MLPTPSPTPLSTPLPALPTAIPPGTEDNPIHMVIKPVGAARLITEAQINEFQSVLVDQTGLVIEVTLVDRYAEALLALCNSRPDNLTVAWLDGVSYKAAIAQHCGQASLQVERRGRGRQIFTGETVHIVAGTQLNGSSIRALVGRSFCRLGYDDYYGWLLPSLMMQASGIDPLNDLD